VSRAALSAVNVRHRRNNDGPNAKRWEGEGLIRPFAWGKQESPHPEEAVLGRLEGEDSRHTLALTAIATRL